MSSPLRQSATDFVASFAGTPAVYTTARSLSAGSLRVFELDLHLQRLVDSSTTLFKQRAPANLKHLVRASMRQGLLAKDLYKQGACKITTVVTQGPAVATHCELLKPRKPGESIVVGLGGRPRDNALVKDLEWVRERAAFVNPAWEETLLTDGDYVLEGSQTNFFAVEPDGVVRTAGAGMLMGTVRACVLDACASLGIPVATDYPPRVADVERWNECFITSTSRFVLGVDEIRWEAADRGRVFGPRRPVTQLIAEWVTRFAYDKSGTVDDDDAKL